MIDDQCQSRRAQQLRAALTEILRSTIRFREGDGTYHNVVNDVYSVACRALNADADTRPRYERIRVPADSLDIPSELYAVPGGENEHGDD